MNERAKRIDEEWRERARIDASVCSCCGAAIPQHSPLWIASCQLGDPSRGQKRLVYSTERAAVCETCGKEHYAISSTGWDRDYVFSGNCRGCGRMVQLVAHRQVAFFCSSRCQSKFYGARFRSRHPKPKKPKHRSQCVVCHQDFTAKREDAKTCSPACRQKDYRQRKSVTDN
jgi:hypothetical protein